MKRLTAVLLALCLLPLCASAQELTEEMTVAVGQGVTVALPFPGYWESEDSDVAAGVGDVIYGYNEGEALLTLSGENGEEYSVYVTVTEQTDAVPALIQSAIRIAISEWEAADGQAFPRSDNSKPANGNKYTTWWGYDCGWCGAFANYCLDSAGVPLEPTDTYKKLKPLDSGEPHGVREAAVPKLDTGFSKMERITQDDPRPGYLVIYGRRDSKGVSAYAFVHVALVTDVKPLGDNKFLISTVEGNLSNRIKRFTYVYDANSPANKEKPGAKTNANMSDAPLEYQTDPKIQYTPHQATWYVTEFCRTWY